jgi:methyltransferase (TIGR00027 family)
MQGREPSRTALAAARHRAAHQILEGGRIFADPFAIRILGEEAGAIAKRAEENPSSRRMRLFIAARTRFAEDALAAAVAHRGVTQLVVLGAGLDTYAYRGALRERLRLFEVDHPSTQVWKRERLSEAGIALPDTLTFAPVDFERETLGKGLVAAGFDPNQRTFFTWLGVIPYLTADAIWSTLGYIAGLARGAHVAFDYSNPPASLEEASRADHDARAARVADLGEPWVTFFDSNELRGKLSGIGFSEVEDLGPAQIVAKYFPNRGGAVHENGGHILHAWTS